MCLGRRRKEKTTKFEEYGSSGLASRARGSAFAAENVLTKVGILDSDPPVPGAIFRH